MNQKLLFKLKCNGRFREIAVAYRTFCQDFAREPINLWELGQYVEASRTSDRSMIEAAYRLAREYERHTR